MPRNIKEIRSGAPTFEIFSSTPSIDDALQTLYKGVTGKNVPERPANTSQKPNANTSKDSGKLATGTSPVSSQDTNTHGD